MNSSGEVFDITTANLKAKIKSGAIIVEDLSLTSDNRLVDM